MLFSSMTFVFLFLPIVSLLYFISRKEIRNHVLLIASFVFYGWGEPRYMAIMILTILVNYFGAIFLSRFRKYAKWILAGTILVNLAFLVYFKYFNFILSNANAIFDMDVKFLDVIMPIGISFYTFQAMSYLIDVYRGEANLQKDFYKLALYITLFPQLVAGPIVKYHDVDEQITNRTETFDKAAMGVKRFIIGLSKKMLIANTLGAVVDKIFEHPVQQFDALTAWLGAFCYSMQLYFDFSGYSDMAIGLGLIFGFKFLENFNYPYISKSITEFWRRWHISLSTWFKEYLYIPLGGNRVARWRMYFNLFVVFLCTGIWHGAQWSFVIWGIWHGFFIILEKATGWGKNKTGWLAFIQHAYTVLVFVIGWVIFRAADLSYSAAYLKTMFGFGGNHKAVYDLPYYIDRPDVIAMIAGVLCCVPLFKGMLGLPYKRKVLRALVNVWLMVLFALSFATMAASTYNPFIYFRF